MREITVEPKPCRDGAGNSGPPRSRQYMTKAGAPVPECSRSQPVSTCPPAVESAPYLPAFVASSCSAIPERLGRVSGNRKLWPLQGDPLADQVFEMRELGADEIGQIHPAPFALHEQVLARRQRLDALAKALDELLRPRRDGAAGERVHEGQQVLGAVVDLAHEEMDLLLIALALAHVGHQRDDARQAAPPHRVKARRACAPIYSAIFGDITVNDLERRYLLDEEAAEFRRFASRSSGWTRASNSTARSSSSV